VTATKRGPGRRSKADELKDFAAAAGIDMETVGDYLGGDLPVPESTPMPDIDDPQQLRDWAANELILHVSSGRANVATVNGLKAVIEFATKQGPRDDADSEERMPLLERAEALPPETAGMLIRQEIARLDELRAAYFAKLEEIEA
jgi:hypothetical protein